MRNILAVILVIIASVFAVYPFIQSGYFSTHDGTWAVIRLAEMVREIKDFQFPARFSGYLNHGYGYPLFNFVYPFPYYVGSLIKASGIGYEDTVKLMFAAATVLSGVLMYFLGRGLGGTVAGLVSAILYVFAPYRIVNLYVRGSLGEIFASVFYPLIFYLILKVVLKPTALRVVMLSFAYFMLFLSHNVSALLFFPFSVIFFITVTASFYENLGRYSIRYFLPSVILAFILSSFFLLPAVFEKGNVSLDIITTGRSDLGFIKPFEFFSGGFDYGARPSFQLGWVHILVFILGLFSFALSGSVQRKKHLHLFIFLNLGLFFSLLLALPVSVLLWGIPLMASVDFPWRIMGVISFILPLYGVFLAVGRITSYLSVFLAFLTISLSSFFIQPKDRTYLPDEFYLTNDATTTSSDELMPLWVKDKPSARFVQKAEIAEGQGVISGVSHNSKSLSFDLQTTGPVKIRVNTVYYPGWKYYSDGESLEPDYSDGTGTVLLSLPQAGQYRIEGKFEETNFRMVSNLITTSGFVLSFFIVLIYSLKKFLGAKGAS